jgi:hypothetical protein
MPFAGQATLHDHALRIAPGVHLDVVLMFD